MKKIIFTLSLCLAAYTMHAQSAVYYDLQNNSVTVSNATFDFWLSPGDAHEYDFDMDNITNSSVTYRVRKVDMTMGSSGAAAYFCLVPGNCYAPISPFTTTPFTMSSSDIYQLQTHFTAGTTTGLCVVHYVLFNDANNADSVTIDMRYNITPTGVAPINNVHSTFSDAKPNPASSALSFSYRFAAPSGNSVVLYNTLGEAVKEIKLDDSEGTLKLDVSDLQSGLYFCSFRTDNKSLATRKVIVTH
jgi:hypothetical protein